MSKIALIGLNKISLGISARLHSLGKDIIVYNNESAYAEELNAMGINAAQSLHDAVSDADYVITFVSDRVKVAELVTGENGICKLMKSSAIHIWSPYVSQEQTKLIADFHSHNDINFVASTVLGVPKEAYQGELTCLVAGEQSLVKKVIPIVELYSDEAVNLGEQHTDANVIKICVNYFAVGFVELYSEVFCFAEKCGLPNDDIHEILHQLLPYFNKYIKNMMKGKYPTNAFSMTDGLKDVSLMGDAFTNAGVSPEVLNTVKRKILTGLNKNMSELDWTAFHKISRQEAGLNDD